MATKKTTGKKLADMMYGNPEGAAFGITPMIGKRREDRQDREAAKSFPVDLARGAVAGFVGMPADILNIPGAVYSAVTDKDLYKIPYGSEDILKNLPFGTETPAGQFASGLGILGGGSANIGPAIRGAKALPGALKTAARNLSTPNTLNPQAGVIKMKGGNWLGGSVESGLKPLRSQTAGRSDPAEMLSRMRERYTPEEIAKLQGASRTHVLESIADLEKEVALNNWVDRNLGNYVKKEMATPEDPVRRLAEEGIVHIPSEQVGVNRYRAPKHREAYGGEQLGKSEAARAWEDASDVAINAPTARTVRANESLYQANPWTEKLSPEERVYALNRPASTQHEISGLGFDHILDVLREDVATGRIRPEQLNKVSMEQAVRRTYEYDQEMAKKMRETALKQQEGFPTYKEYPEGYRWIELNLTPEQKAIAKDYQERFQTELGKRVAAHPGDKSGKIPTAEIKEQLQKEMGPNPMQGLEDALKYEGNTMGHCVGGYCPDVVEGRSRIYSLRDAKGEPHVTVEVAPRKASIHGGEDDAAYARIVDEADRMFGAEAEGTQEYMSFVNNKLDLLHQDQPPAIVQIKGKQNKAPKEDYLPYVQDFVGSGQWSDVGDLQNTGLKTLDQAFPDYEMVKYFNRANPDKRYVSQKEIDDFTKEWNSPEASPDGMARGGPVHFSDNPDVMQLELAGGGIVRMGVGGAMAKTGTKGGAKAAKEAVKPNLVIKSKPGIIVSDLIDEDPEIAKRLGALARAKRQADIAAEGKRLELAKQTQPSVGYRQTTEKKPDPLVGTRFINEAPFGLNPNDPFDLGKFQGASGLVLPWDSQSRNVKTTQVSGMDLPNQIFRSTHGGVPYSFDTQHAARGIVGSSGEDISKRVKTRADTAVRENIDLGGSGELLHMPITMGFRAEDYALPYSEFSFDLINYKLMTGELTLKQAEELANMVRNFEPPKYKGKKPFADFAGFTSPEGLEQIYTGQGINAPSGELRKAIADRIIHQKGSQEKLGFNAEDLMNATTYEPLRGVDKGFIGSSVMRNTPTGMQLSPSAGKYPYDTDFSGEHLGRLEDNVDVEALFYRTLNPIKRELMDRETKKPYTRESLRNAAIGAIEKRNENVSQMIDQQFLDDYDTYITELRKPTEYKKGGRVRKYAEGGEITADDLILEERKL